MLDHFRISDERHYLRTVIAETRAVEETTGPPENYDREL